MLRAQQGAWTARTREGSSGGQEGWQLCRQPWSWGVLWPDRAGLRGRRGQSSSREAGRGAGGECGAVGGLPRAGAQPDWRGREELGEMSVWGQLLGRGSGEWAPETVSAPDVCWGSLRAS